MPSRRHRVGAVALAGALTFLFAAGVAAVVSCRAKTREAKNPTPASHAASLQSCAPGAACECEDGIDNDRDGLVDWQFDLGCTARNDSSEGGVPTGKVEGGWTVFEKSPATQIIYASAEGNDDWTGLAPSRDGVAGPKRTLGAAIRAMRPGHADWVLLRRGDTFEGGASLRVSGLSMNEPVLIASYGPETKRPVVQGGVFLNDGPQENFVIAHIQLNEGFAAVQSARNVLVEGCFFQGAAGIAASGANVAHSNWLIRRNVLSRSNDNGFYFYGVSGLLVEENVLYRPSTLAGANHGMYITRSGNSDVVTRGNILYLDKPHGNAIMQRAGGLSEGNVVGGTGWNAISFGACNDEGGGTCLPPVTAQARGNLIVERRGDLGCGIGFDEPHVSKAEATNTIFADDAKGVQCDRVESQPFVTEQGTVVLPTPVDPKNPGTLLGAYNSLQGGAATTEAFFENAVQQRKFAYRTEYSAAPVIEYARSLASQAR
jgi:hypothetical protein